MKKEADNYPILRIMQKIYLITWFAIVILIVGIFSVFGLYSLIISLSPSGNSEDLSTSEQAPEVKKSNGFWKTPFVIQEESEQDVKSKSFVFFILTIISFVIFLSINIFILFYIKKLIVTLSESNREISGGISSLKQSENDEIKELVTTRNVLLMKLMDNKKSSKKSKRKKQ